MQNELKVGDKVVSEKGRHKGKKGIVTGPSYGPKRVNVNFDDGTGAVNSLQSKYRKL